MLDENKQMCCYVVIEKNSPLPAIGMRLGTASPGQMVGMLPVFRGGETNPLKNKFMGDLTLTFTRSLMPTLLRFELTLDRDGILNVDGAEIDLDETPLEMLQYIPDSDLGRLKIKRRTRVEMKMPQ
jgi:hypothetical protein